MSIFNFSGGTLLASGGGYSGVTIDTIPEDMHVINPTYNVYNYSSGNLPSHATTIIGGDTSAALTPALDLDSIFNVYSMDIDMAALNISKTTNSVDIAGILTAGSYGNLPKWVTNISKASATSLKLTWNDGTTSTLNLNITKNITGKIKYVKQNALASIYITADSVPYNGTITLSSIDTSYAENTSSKFAVDWNDGDFVYQNSFYTITGDGNSELAQTNNRDVYAYIYNANGTYLGSLKGLWSVNSVRIRIGSVINVTRGAIASIKY